MKGEIENPLDCVVALHNLQSKKIPKDIIKLIVEYSIPIMYCSKCGYILQKDYNKNKSLSWIISAPKARYGKITDNYIKCKQCYPTLNELWTVYKLNKMFNNNKW